MRDPKTRETDPHSRKRVRVLDTPTVKETPLSKLRVNVLPEKLGD